MKNISRLLLVSLLLCMASLTHAQTSSKLISITIPANLKEDANAVIRKHDVMVEIKDIDNVSITEDRIVTVFNQSGMNNVNAYQHYSDTWQIKDLKAIIYDALGNEIVTFKERDFRDASAVDGGTLYADDRVKHLDYIPRNFPVTIHYTSNSNVESTAFLPEWRPIESFYCSTESSSYKISNPGNIPLKFKEMNFEGFNVQRIDDLYYQAANLSAIKNEVYRPDFNTYVPRVKFALKEFVMEGVQGYNNDWQDFGKWMYDELLVDTRELPEEVKEHIKSLTRDATTDDEKARIVYQFVQNRSRYISVQVGIGGWKPIDAAEVHKMAYGDCKGLTNYTKALLDVVGVTSHYAAIYGGADKKSMDTDFSMTEGNHDILYLPELGGEKDYWLECTSKNAPFGFMGDFTDDRDALVMFPEGGKLVHTTTYPTSQNTQITNGKFVLDKNGKLSGSAVIKTQGVQYSWRSDISTKSTTDQKKSYLDFWSHLNGLNINSVDNSADKSIPEFNENVELEVDSYSSKTGDLLLFQPVILNRHNKELPVYEKRQFEIEVERGYIDTDYYELNFVEGLTVDALPDPVDLKTKYGNYSLKVLIQDENTLSVERHLEMVPGIFDSEEYEDFRAFRTAIIKHDNSRGVLKITK